MRWPGCAPTNSASAHWHPNSRGGHAGEIPARRQPSRDERELRILRTVARQRAIEVASVVLAVLADHGFQRLVEADGVVGQLLQALAALQPAGRPVVSARVLLKVLP